MSYFVDDDLIGFDGRRRHIKQWVRHQLLRKAGAYAGDPEISREIDRAVSEIDLYGADLDGRLGSWLRDQLRVIGKRVGEKVRSEAQRLVRRVSSRLTSKTGSSSAKTPSNAKAMPVSTVTATTNPLQFLQANPIYLVVPIGILALLLTHRRR